MTQTLSRAKDHTATLASSRRALPSHCSTPAPGLSRSTKILRNTHGSHPFSPGALRTFNNEAPGHIESAGGGFRQSSNVRTIALIIPSEDTSRCPMTSHSRTMFATKSKGRPLDICDGGSSAAHCHLYMYLQIPQELTAVLSCGR